MFHAFTVAPSPTVAHKSKFHHSVHSVDTSKTKSVFDFFFCSKKKKKTEKDSYTSLENSLWGSRTLKTTKALLFAK